MLRVRDIMTVEVFTLPASIAIEEAARALSEQHITGAPVVAEGQVVGVLSRSDLSDPDRGLGANAAARVSDVMTPLVFFLRPEDPAASAVKLMLYEGVHRLLVIRESGALAGIVTPMDVLKAVSRGEHIDESQPLDPESVHPHADPEMVRAVIEWQVDVSKEPS